MKPANSIVLDSSAVLALVLEERGGETVSDLLARLESESDLHIAISTVTWCEILTRLYRDHDSMTIHDLDALLAGVELIPLARPEAELAAEYSRAYRSISLGDRACLALAATRHAAAWTTDKAWSKLKLSVRIEVLR